MKTAGTTAGGGGHGHGPQVNRRVRQTKEAEMTGYFCGGKDDEAEVQGYFLFLWRERR